MLFLCETIDHRFIYFHMIIEMILGVNYRPATTKFIKNLEC